MDVGGVDLALGEAERGEEVETRIVELGEIEAELLDAERFAQRPFVEGELDVERGGEGFFHGGDQLLVGQLPFCFSVPWLMPGDWPRLPWPTA